MKGDSFVQQLFSRPDIREVVTAFERGQEEHQQQQQQQQQESEDEEGEDITEEEFTPPPDDSKCRVSFPFFSPLPLPLSFLFPF
jgi:hypothetical protein